jgi:hypothetical protein
MDIKRINQITGDILNYEQRVSRLQSDIADLKDENRKYVAHMTVTIGNSKRYLQEFSMNSSEVRAVLERKLAEDTETLEKIKDVYEKELNEQPA